MYFKNPTTKQLDYSMRVLQQELFIWIYMDMTNRLDFLTAELRMARREWDQQQQQQQQQQLQQNNNNKTTIQQHINKAKADW